ncbi:MAG: RNA polymerase sigma factor [Kiritimatiellae bacterium]|nr:RNA polymerase sigma factor [Kiritimatiellia bacterium]
MRNGREQQVMGRILAGDRAAVQEFYRLYVTAIYNFALYRLGKNEDLAEEAVNEIFERAFRHMREYDPARGEVYTWLVNIGRSVTTKIIRREQKWKKHELHWQQIDERLREIYEAIDEEAIPDEILETEETRLLVRTTMSQLPLKYRRLLEERYWKEKSNREIAGMLGVSEKAVESMLARARLAFKKAFLAVAHEMGGLGLEPAP